MRPPVAAVLGRAATTRLSAAARMPEVAVASRLRSADARFFGGDGLFERVARATCRADANVPRKELAENWAMATRVHDEFFRDAVAAPRRVVDVAAGHGLLGWFLLALCASTGHAPTIYAVDRAMPASATALRDSFGAAFPSLRASHRFIVDDAARVRAEATTLIAALHACGELSDVALDAAVRSGAPCALVPCCHSRKNLDALPEARADVEALGLDEALDAARARRLVAAGYEVRRGELCPREVTPKNQLIFARPTAIAVCRPAPAPPLYPRALPGLSWKKCAPR